MLLKYFSSNLFPPYECNMPVLINSITSDCLPCQFGLMTHHKHAMGAQCYSCVARRRCPIVDKKCIVRHHLNTGVIWKVVLALAMAHVHVLLLIDPLSLPLIHRCPLQILQNKIPSHRELVIDGFITCVTQNVKYGYCRMWPGWSCTCSDRGCNCSSNPA